MVRENERIEKLMKKDEKDLTDEEKQILHNYWYERECKYCRLRGSCQELNLYGCSLFENSGGG